MLGQTKPYGSFFVSVARVIASANPPLQIFPSSNNLSVFGTCF